MCVIDIHTQGFLPGPPPCVVEKFGADATLAIILDDGGGDVQVFKRTKPADLKALEKFNASKLDIWALESYVLSYRNVGQAALTTRMARTVDELEHPELKRRIENLQETMLKAQEQARDILEIVTELSNRQKPEYAGTTQGNTE